MKCPRCSKDVEKSWDFCPHCGAMLTMNLLDDMMEKMNRQMKEISKSLEKNFEIFDLSPYFKKSGGGGFSIKIVQSNHKRPKVSVRTFGDLDSEKIEKQVYKRLGAKPAGNDRDSGFLHRLGLSKDGKPETKKLPVPKKTEEPNTDVKRLASKVMVVMDMPGVKSEKDIEIRELENSIEVRALAGDKAYFKILTKPEEFSLSSRKFSKGKLRLEFS